LIGSRVGKMQEL